MGAPVFAKATWKSAKKSSPATKLLGYGRPFDLALPSRRWHCAQMETICLGSLECLDRKSTRLNSSHLVISYAVFCLKKKKTKTLYTMAALRASTPPLYTYALRTP